MNMALSRELERLGFVVSQDACPGSFLYRGDLSLRLTPTMERVVNTLVQANNYAPPVLYYDARNHGYPTRLLHVNDELEATTGNPAIDEHRFYPLFQEEGWYYLIDSEDPREDDPAVYVIEGDNPDPVLESPTLSGFLGRIYLRGRARDLLADLLNEGSFDDPALFCILGNVSRDCRALNLARKEIESLKGLGLFGGTEHLWLTGNRVSDIGELRTLVALRRAFLQNNQIREARALSNCQKLEVLDLEGNPLDDLRGFEGLEQVEVLCLKRTHVRDLSPLKGMHHLCSLNLEGTSVEDISVLAGLPHLHTVLLRETPVEDIAPLSGLKELENLSWKGNMYNPWSGTWTEEIREKLFPGRIP